MSESPYNPLDKENLGLSVANALLEKSPEPLPPSEPFQGAGVYAIYYTGPVQLYSAIRGCQRPIYVGKAIPAGARTGKLGIGLPAGNALFSRLSEHARSAEAALLHLKDFRCRYLVVDDIWIPLGEALLIEKFQPVWNVLVDGFGNHDPGAGRRGQQCSKWDTLHPGRSWAQRLQPNERTEAEIAGTVRDFFANRPVETIPLADAMGDDN